MLFNSFISAADAAKAKNDLVTRLNSQLVTQNGRAVPVRVGFGKTEGHPQTPASAGAYSASGTHTPTSALMSATPSGTGDGLQSSPTRALWIGSLPQSTTAGDLLKVFAPYGTVESARVLAHKQCGFCNFENLDDAIRARHALNGLDFLGKDIGPVKIGFARIPSKTPVSITVEDDPIDPARAYAALKQLGGASSVPLEQQISSGNLENYRSPMALALAANGLSASGPRTAAALTQALQGAVGLSPSVVATEFGHGMLSPSLGYSQSNDILEHQVLMRELSGDSADAEMHVQMIAQPRPDAVYFVSVAPPADDAAVHRFRHLDTPQLRDIRRRLDAPPQLLSQADIDSLAVELLDAIVVLASDYIGNVIVQKLFEKCSSSLRVSLAEIAWIVHTNSRECSYLCSSASHRT